MNLTEVKLKNHFKDNGVHPKIIKDLHGAGFFKNIINGLHGAHNALSPQMSAAGISAGKMSAGKMYAGGISAGKLTAGKMSAGAMSAGKLTGGKMTAGAIKKSKSACEFTKCDCKQLKKCKKIAKSGEGPCVKKCKKFIKSNKAICSWVQKCKRYAIDNDVSYKEALIALKK